MTYTHTSVSSCIFNSTDSQEGYRTGMVLTPTGDYTMNFVGPALSTAFPS